jgi:autotransporter-associated beta strand protein
MLGGAAVSAAAPQLTETGAALRNPMITRSGTLSFTRPLTNVGGITKSGSATVILTSANTCGGDTLDAFHLPL